MEGHPMKAIPNWMRRAIPIALHGDAVPVTGCGKVWSKSMLAMSWCSLLGSGTTVAFNFLIFAYFCALGFKGTGPLNTDARIFKIIVWSLHWAYLGKWPTHDVDGTAIVDDRAGTPLAGDEHMGFFLVLWVKKGDLEYFHDVPSAKQPLGTCYTCIYLCVYI
jgi:hypothetical protein